MGDPKVKSKWAKTQQIGDSTQQQQILNNKKTFERETEGNMAPKKHTKKTKVSKPVKTGELTKRMGPKIQPEW